MECGAEWTKGTKCGKIFFKILLILLLSIVKASAQNIIMPAHMVTIRHDNDFLNLFGGGTDEYYTAGMVLKYGFNNSSPKNIFRKIQPLPFNTETSFITIGVTQWMYTPGDLQTRTHEQKDYPYSGSLYLEISRAIIFHDRNLMQSSLWLGIMGPMELAEQTQLFVHRVLDFEKPEGWGGQLPNYPIINYNLYYERSLLPGEHFVKVNAVAVAQIGSFQNTLSGGLSFTFTKKINNSFPDRYYITTPDEKFNQLKFFIQIKPTLRFVATNAILEGGLFQNKNYYHINSPELNRLIFSGELNFGIHIRRFSLGYKQILETREFKTVHEHMYDAIMLEINL